MSNTPDEKLREILGEDDWRYTEKPSKIQALIAEAELKARKNEVGMINMGDNEYPAKRLTQLKENK